jgi:hypothetical protein
MDTIIAIEATFTASRNTAKGLEFLLYQSSIMLQTQMKVKISPALK